MIESDSGIISEKRKAISRLQGSRMVQKVKTPPKKRRQYRRRPRKNQSTEG